MNGLMVLGVETEQWLLRQVTVDDLDEWGQRIIADPGVIRFIPKREITPRAYAERALGAFNKFWMEFQPCDEGRGIYVNAFDLARHDTI